MEQSNSSLVFHVGESSASTAYCHPSSTAEILKLYRIFAVGSNPDVALSEALSNSGLLPPHLSALRVNIGEHCADLARLSQFIPQAQSEWDHFLNLLQSSKNEHGQLCEEATLLGAFTRSLHSALAAEEAPCPTSAEEATALRASWRERARHTLVLDDSLAESEGVIEMIYTACAHVNWPSRQRIHGDYHLGQILKCADDALLVTDFEGEPLSSPSSSCNYDIPLRDVAGILRSFDYASAYAGLDASARSELNAKLRGAFFAGYGELDEEEEILVEALILDKALYELRYELTYRPTWAHIPASAIKEITGS